MIKQFKSPVLALLVVNFLITLPLYFFTSVELAYTSFVLSLFHTFIWFVIIQVILVGQKVKMNSVSLAMGGIIGLKTFFSFALFIIAFKAKLLEGNTAIMLFLVLYAVYSLLIYVDGNSRLENDPE